MQSNRTHRLLRHVVTDHMSVRRAFPAPVARARSKRRSAPANGRTAARCASPSKARCRRCACCTTLTPRERALEVFGLLRVWDTEENAGVLVYLLLADRGVEIVADRGIDRVVDATAWRSICARMEAAFAEGRYADGVVQGIADISALLARHFPRAGADANELPDRPVIL